MFDPSETAVHSAADIAARDRAVADYARAYLDLMLSYRQLGDFAEALQRYSIFYQPTGDGRPSALTARLSRGSSSTVPERREFVR